MPYWKFFDYRCEGDGYPIRDWYEAQSAEVRAVLDATVTDLGNTEDWDDPDLLSFKVLDRKPEHAGLAEIRFYVLNSGKKVHYRAMGRWRKEAHEFIFLTGLRKNGRTPIPPNALNEAIRMLAELENGKGEIDERDLEETGEGQAIS